MAADWHQIGTLFPTAVLLRVLQQQSCTGGRVRASQGQSTHVSDSDLMLPKYTLGLSLPACSRERLDAGDGQYLLYARRQ